MQERRFRTFPTSHGSKKALNYTLVAGGIVCLLPDFAWAAGAAAPPLNLTRHWVGYFALIIMFAAYVIAMLEEVTELRKSKPMLLGSAVIWFAVVFVYKQHGASELAVNAFTGNLLAYIELLLFIMVSMTYLNAMEDMQVFNALRVWLVNKRLTYRQLFWITGVLVFLIATVCNGLTAGLLMGAVVVAVGKNNPRFASLACVNIVVATNAGGSFSPVGGISTLFVWQKGVVPFTEFFRLFIPCVVNFAIPAALMHFAIPRKTPAIEPERIRLERGAKRVIFLFAVTIALAVGFDVYFGMPPAAGMMAGLSLLQFFSYYLRKTGNRLPAGLDAGEPDMPHEIMENRSFDIFQQVGRLEWDTLLFFYGAIMGVGALSFIGYLDAVSQLLYGQLHPTAANVLIGLSSAFIDNGTLMFAVLSMNPPISQGQWLLVTLTLGVGGSLLAIGSAPGVGLLGQAKGLYTFSSHMKWFPAILLGYFASIAVHYLVNARYF
jgi:Na+/H+ antiporter NhaD/arsenite permease-like protein